MYRKKECVAMLLAGGQGSRLYALTVKTAKPAVSFGGKYRIIDFPLSNCTNSKLDTVGVLTQYQPLMLNEYIGNGLSWDLNRTFGGVSILPPYQGHGGADWYRGTANAIYQNLDFIDIYSPEYVIILSGDHIYKMDYNAMLKDHKRTGAACTIAVLNVTLEEASRFGIMNTDENNKIYEFEEKPKHPKSTKASMGIYIFDYKKLKSYLTADEADPNSSNDFGKNIIPNMLNAGEAMYAYDFEGYWKDVGTIQSLWEANMDLLGRPPKFDLYDRSWRIFFRNNPLPPHYAATDAVISNSLVTEGCEIYGAVKNSVMFRSVKVARGATVKDSVILPGAVIGEGATVEYAIVDSETVIEAGAKIGAPKESGAEITVVGSGLRITADMDIPVGCMCNAEKLAEIVGKDGMAK